MAPPTFPLRWESTGDKWWYASPIDWAAANGHYDLVRELLRLDGNHLIKLTSLRRVRRLEAVWDDEEQYHDVAKCRCEVARQLFDECHAQKKEGKNSLIVAGYGGWLLYTAASAGDLSFVQKLLRVNPLLVFGDGEYGLTDILYAAARSKNLKVFRVIYGFARSPRFNRGDEEEQIKEILPLDFKMELKNRAVHAAARGGNLMGLKELLTHFGDVLEYRDVNGSTVLHAAAGRGQLEVVIYLIASYDKIISFTDNEGNTPLHIAAYRGQLPVLEALVQSSPSSASLVNNVGNTFLHMAVAGFHTPAFRRLDRQIELIKQLLSNKCFNIETVINIQNNDGKTALHLAIMGGNDHCNLGGLLMGCREINVNIRDDRGMTPLDYLKRQRRSPSSDMLIRRLVSVGGVSTFKKLDDAVRKAFASHLKMQSMCSSSSPGASFRVPDSEIFQTTGIDRLLNPCLDKVVVSAHFRSLSEASQCESASVNVKKSGTLHSAKKRLKTMLHWRPVLRRKDQKDMTASEETPPIPLRERFSTNKRTLAVRSNISSPTNRKKFASGVAFGILQDQTLVSISTSFPRSSLSSYSSVEKGKGVISMVDETARPSCSRHMNDHYSDASNVIRRQGSLDKRFVNPSLWFRGHHISIKNPMGKPRIKQPVPLAA